VGLVRAARHRADASDRAGRRRPRAEGIAITAARDRQSRAPLARPRRRTTTAARSTRAALATLRADAFAHAAAAAFHADAPQAVEAWIGEFLAALAEEAEAGFSLLRLLEREWFAARAAIQDRRRDSHAAAAVDIMAAAPIVSATSLAAGLGIAVKNATALLDAFVSRGIAIEVTHRSKRRLFGLKHLAPLRAEARPSRRARSTGVSARRGRAGAFAGDMPPEADYTAGGDVGPSLRQSLVLTPLERKEFEFSDLDDWMREADQVIRRSQAILDRIAKDELTGHRGDTT
jgi:hypothetical protein